MYKLNIIVGYGEVVFNVDLTYSHTFFGNVKTTAYTLQASQITYWVVKQKAI